MRSLLKVGLALLVLAFVLIGMSYSMLRAQGTTRALDPESRAVVSETRKLEAGIRAVHVSGPINLTLRQGAVPSLVIKGEQRLMGNIHASKGDNGLLLIGPRGMLLHPRQPVQAILVLPQIDVVSVSGGGDSSVNGFSGDQVAVELQGSGHLKFNGRFRIVNGTLQGNGDLELNGGTSERVTVTAVGSGDVTVVGSTDLFQLEQTGSGDVDAEHLASTDAALNVVGTGRVTVNVRNKFEARMRGGVDVIVHGDPQERSITGSGSGQIEFR